MKIKKEKTEILTENNLAFNLSEIIENKQRTLIRLSNIELITLFWQIGKELNKSFSKAKKSLAEKQAFQIISAKLTSNYGPFFSERKFKKMGLFAELFPEFSEVEKFIYYVSWEHILLLLQIPDWHAMKFYLKSKIVLGSSVENLRKQISGGLYEKSQAFKAHKTGQSLLQIPQPSFGLVTKNDLTLKKLFNEPLLFSFQKLTEPSKTTKKLSVKSRNSISMDNQLFEEIKLHIERYRAHQNSWLNSHFNLLFWEIGKCINQHVYANKIKDYKGSMIREISLLLGKKYGKSFVEDQLYASIEFEKKFNDPGIVSRIAYLISWEHILVILSLEEIEAALFYARLAAIKGLSVEKLREQITKKIYEKTPGAKKLEEALLYSLKNPRTETKIVEKGNSIEENVAVYYEFNDLDSLVVQDVFKNSYFIDFVQHIKR